MAGNQRHEAIDLVEIDAYATSGKTKEINEEDLMTLSLVRTGSLWTNSTAYWTGKVDDLACSVCNEEEETAEHIIWRCKPLDERRKEVDSILAGIKCEHLPVPIREA